MPTPAERQALLFLAAVLSLGTGVRVLRGRGEEVPPSTRTALAGQLAAVDSAIAARGRRSSRATGSTANRPARSSPPSPTQSPFVSPPTPPPTPPPAPPPTRPPAPPGETRRTPAPLVDLDTAPESVLVTLPGIGPALAKRIVQDRERSGSFGSVTALTRVAGIGEKTAARLAPHVTFSSSPRRSP